MDYSKSSGKSSTELREEHTLLMHLAAQGKTVKIGKMLFDAIKKHDRYAAKQYLQEEQKIDQALLLAVKNYHFKVVQLIVNCALIEIDLNIKDVDGNTPLMIAISHGDLNMVNLLIYAGATSSLNLCNNLGHIPLSMAVQRNYQKIASSLLLTMDSKIVATLKRNPFYQNVIEKFEEEQNALQKKHAVALAAFLKTYKPYQGKDTEVIKKYKQKLQAKAEAENMKKSSLDICHAFGKLELEKEHSPKRGEVFSAYNDPTFALNKVSNHNDHIKKNRPPQQPLVHPPVLLWERVPGTYPYQPDLSASNFKPRM